MFDFNPGVIALLIPIIAIIGGIALAIVGIITKSREEELRHKERIVAMEKGLPVPETPREEHRPRSARNRTGGLVLTFLGIALIILRLVSDNYGALTAGVIVAAIGIGLLLASWFEKRDAEKR
ncbi:MAG: DUF6249 domain-containing protein [Candidatus Krumholzibacteriaceae bacterium]|jgi:hypothetical protein